MSACYINVQFFAITCCKLFLTALNYTTAIKTFWLRQHRKNMKHRLMMIGIFSASAAVSLSVIYGLLGLAGVI
jgi:hypothetical protein